MDNFFIERRRHKRISISKEDTFVDCNDRFGQIENISLGGMKVSMLLGSSQSLLYDLKTIFYRFLNTA